MVLPAGTHTVSSLVLLEGDTEIEITGTGSITFTLPERSSLMYRILCDSFLSKVCPLIRRTKLVFMCRKMSGMAAQRYVTVQQKRLAQRNVRRARTADRSAA